MIQLPTFPFFDSAPVLEFFKTFELFKQEKDNPMVMYNPTAGRYEINPDNEFQISVLSEMMDIDSKYRDLAFSEQKLTFDFFRSVIDQPAFISDDHSRLRKFVVDWYAAQRTQVTKSRHAVDPYTLTDGELDDLLLSFGFPYPYAIASSQKAEFLHSLFDYYQSKGSPKVLGDILSFFNIEDFVITEWWLKYDYRRKQLVAASQPVYPKSQQYNPDYYTQVEYKEFVYSDPYWHYDKPGSDEKAIELFTNEIENEFGDTVLENEVTLPSILPFISLYSVTHNNLYDCHTSILNRKFYEDFEWWIKYTLNKVNPDLVTSPVASDCYLDGYGYLNVYNGEEWVSLGFVVPEEWITTEEEKASLVPSESGITSFSLIKNWATNVYTSDNVSLLELLLGFKYIVQCKFLTDVSRIHDYASADWGDDYTPEGTVVEGVSENTLIYNPNTDTDWLYYRGSWRDLKYNTEYYTDEEVVPDTTSLIVHFIPENENTTQLLFYNNPIDYQFQYVQGGNLVKTPEDDPYRDSIDDKNYDEIEQLYLSLSKNAYMKDDEYPTPYNDITDYPMIRHCEEYDEYGEYAEEYECRCNRCQKQDVCFLRLDYYSAREKQKDYKAEFEENFYTKDSDIISMFFNATINAKKILQAINPSFLEVINAKFRTTEVILPDNELEFRKYQYLYAKDLAYVLQEIGLDSFKTLPNLFLGNANYKIIKNIIDFFKPYRVRFREFATPIIFDNRVTDGLYVDDSICTNLVSTIQENIYANERLFTMSVLNFNDGYGWDTNVFELNLEDIFLSRIETNYWESYSVYDIFYFTYELMFVEDDGPFTFENCRVKDVYGDLPALGFSDGYRSFNPSTGNFEDSMDANLYDDGEVVINACISYEDEYSNTVYATTHSFQNISYSREPELVEIFDITKVATIENNIVSSARIYNADQLNAVRYSMDQDFILMNDIDLAEYDNWAPIGTSANPFTGAINGQGHSITNLKINSSGELYQGLFGYTLNAEITNVKIEDAVISVNGNYAGILSGYSGYSIISQCSVSGNITNGGFYTGGLFGGIRNTQISDCYSLAVVSGRSRVAGITGLVYSATALELSHLTRCYASGLISSDIGVTGGLISQMNGYSSYVCSVNSFWNTETTGQADSESGGTGITTAEMEIETTFTDATWDFTDIWEMEYDGFPILQYASEAEDGNWLDNPEEWTPISSIEELQLIGSDPYEYPIDGKYYLTNDIEAYHTRFWNENLDPLIPFDYLGFLPIGELVLDGGAPDLEASTPFEGILDGNGFSINNLYLANSAVTCFIYLNFGIVRNITFRNLIIDNLSYGALFLLNYTDYLISNCHIINGELNTYLDSAPLCILNYGTIEDSSYQGSINRVSGYTMDEIGGLVFNNIGGGVISGCYSDVTIVGDGLCGGLAYSSLSAEIENSYSKCNIEASTSADSYVGGLVASAVSTTISNCFSVGELYGSTRTGGLVAYSSNSDIDNCYSACSVNIGVSGVNGTTYFGGLIGLLNGGSVENCYSTGYVESSGGNDGGLIGGVGGGPTTTSCYWDVFSSQQLTSAGTETDSNTFLMQNSDTFTDWDFENVWVINENNDYPVLRFFEKIITDYGWLELTNFGITEFGHMYSVNDDEEIVSDSDLEYVGGNDFNNRNSLIYIFNNGILLEDSGYIAQHNGERFVGKFDLSYNIEIENSEIPEGAIPIYTVEDLQLIGAEYGHPVDGYFILMNDIDMTGITDFIPIGFVSDPYDVYDIDANSFQGTFNGNGHTISNLTVEADNFEIGYGLFGYCYNCHIYDLYLEDVNVIGFVGAGALVGICDDSSLIERCYSTGDVYAIQIAGGLIGVFPGDTGQLCEVKDCFSGCNVSVEELEAGGLMGYSSGITTNCYSYGYIDDISGDDTGIGGLIGYTDGVTQTTSFSFWDMDTSGQATSAGSEIGLTTLEMYDMDSYLGWDFINIWVFSGGYAELINPRPQVTIIQSDQIKNRIRITDEYDNVEDLPDYSIGYSSLLNIGTNSVSSEPIIYTEKYYRNEPLLALKIDKKKDYNKITINSISVLQYVWGYPSEYKIIKNTVTI